MMVLTSSYSTVCNRPSARAPLPSPTQVKYLQTSLGKINPFQTVQYLLEQAQSLVQQHAAGRDHLDAAGFPTWKTEACRAWSTFAALAKGTVVGLPSWCTGEKVRCPASAPR